jgi:hypothetical protein
MSLATPTGKFLVIKRAATLSELLVQEKSIATKLIVAMLLYILCVPNFILIL